MGCTSANPLKITILLEGEDKLEQTHMSDTKISFLTEEIKKYFKIDSDMIYLLNSDRVEKTHHKPISKEKAEERKEGDEAHKQTEILSETDKKDVLQIILDPKHTLSQYRIKDASTVYVAVGIMEPFLLMLKLAKQSGVALTPQLIVACAKERKLDLVDLFKNKMSEISKNDFVDNIGKFVDDDRDLIMRTMSGFGFNTLDFVSHMI